MCSDVVISQQNKLGGELRPISLLPVVVVTVLGKRRPSVFGANLYNQQLALSSDNEDVDTQGSVETLHRTNRTNRRSVWNIRQ